jgi:RHS repeat-associated protein
MTPSRLIAFLAAFVLSLAGGSEAAAKSARLEILAAVESASSEWARASAERVWENVASEGNLASGPRDYPYAQVVEEYTSQASGTKTLAATFTFADELVSQTRYAGTAGALIPTTRFVHVDGFGSTRWLMDTSGAITDKIDYDAFGSEVSRTGTTNVEHLYRSEAFDPNLGFYYLRARWLDPRAGRFSQMDSWRGNLSSPITLNKYLYADADPTNGFDPTGLYTQDFGYRIEEEVERQYLATHQPCACYFGRRQYFDPASYLKPDVMNWGTRQFMEIKPFTPSGIAKGIAQLAVYTSVYSRPPFSFSPDAMWTPIPAFVDGRQAYFANLSGIIFYTDDRALAKEIAVASLATAAVTFRRAAMSAATRLGADAMLRAAANAGIRTIASVNAGRLVFQSQMAIITWF